VRQDHAQRQLWKIRAYGFQRRGHVGIARDQHQLFDWRAVDGASLPGRKAIHADRDMHVGFFFFEFPDIDFVLPRSTGLFVDEAWRPGGFELVPPEMHGDIGGLQGTHISVLGLLGKPATGGEFGFYRGGEVVHRNQLAGRVLDVGYMREQLRQIQPLVRRTGQQPVEQVVAVNEEGGAHNSNPWKRKNRPGPVFSPQRPANLIAAYGVELWGRS